MRASSCVLALTGPFRLQRGEGLHLFRHGLLCCFVRLRELLIGYAFGVALELFIPPFNQLGLTIHSVLQCAHFHHEV